MEHNEILGMDAALKYINQTLVDKIGDITLQVSTSDIVYTFLNIFCSIYTVASKV
jgi:hypothetical protein